MSSAVSDARTKLYDALTGELVESPWRVHRTSPAQIAAPSVYVDAVELGRDTATGVGIIVATFPVVAVVDGTVRRQVEELDDLLARIWTAALRSGLEPSDSRAMALDVGGANLRAHVVRVDVYLAAVALCPPSLIPASVNGGASYA